MLENTCRLWRSSGPRDGGNNAGPLHPPAGPLPFGLKLLDHILRQEIEVELCRGEVVMSEQMLQARQAIVSPAPWELSAAYCIRR